MNVTNCDKWNIKHGIPADTHSIFKEEKQILQTLLEGRKHKFLLQKLETEGQT